jgi:hypothetical protein
MEAELLYWIPRLLSPDRGPMSDKSIEWKSQLQDIILNKNDPNFAGKVAELRDALEARLRIMGPTDHDEREAIKNALAALAVMSPKDQKL